MIFLINRFTLKDQWFDSHKLTKSNKVCYANPPKRQFLFADPRPIFIANTSIWWGGPSGPRGGVSSPKIEIYQANPPREATFVWCSTPNYLSKYPYLVGWPLWGPWLNRAKPTPRSNFCLLAPALFSLQTPQFDGVAPAGRGVEWAPQK